MIKITIVSFDAISKIQGNNICFQTPEYATFMKGKHVK